MIKKISNLFNKEEMDFNLPSNDKTVFTLMVDKIQIGKLRCYNGLWEFTYSEEFKNNQHEYKRIAGFPDLDKTYQKETLWPFFLTRIPGLKQPAIKEIIEKENIDSRNEVALLKRFGKHSIANPYELIPG
ncbi:HipA N-terminal domain-containing protein [Chryseolinea lacunae]|uniref:HipA N-terminal subdomain 1 domain-containing protein n=1 Tax=Chryseolinea lacunae TaxID=2801331 RepID=A0ABS1KM68_9BACT|nr:HipA N-terminal domain-containing protein [Chryseolinea lacunae]MBL0740423.1 hypothetical protein [Chryseolinea lacunae]